jgi:cytoskeletal protein RodZ
MLIQFLTASIVRGIGRIPAHLFSKGITELNQEKLSMTRRVPQRIILSFVCALALILIPLAYSPVWAQSTYSSTTTQQEKTDQKTVDQNQNNPDLNQTQTQSNQPSTDVNSSTETRQKPDTSATEQNQNQNQSDSNANQTTTKQNRSTTTKSSSSTTTETNQNPDQNASDRNLPNTAGELPLIALIGLMSFGAAVGTRLLAYARSSR